MELYSILWVSDIGPKIIFLSVLFSRIVKLISDPKTFFVCFNYTFIFIYSYIHLYLENGFFESNSTRQIQKTNSLFYLFLQFFVLKHNFLSIIYLFQKQAQIKLPLLKQKLNEQKKNLIK